MVYAIIFATLFALSLIWVCFYTRAKNDFSYVRTGLGGELVVMNGRGALVLPIFHVMFPIKMVIHRIEVNCSNSWLLKTKDEIPLEVSAEFSVKVKPLSQSIANAAKTLGLNTMQTDRLKQVIEGSLVDSLKVAAAKMNMEELSEQRGLFIETVQALASEKILGYGLELEAVSLTSLNRVK